MKSMLNSIFFIPHPAALIPSNVSRPGGSATTGALLARARDVRTARDWAILAGC
jgi:hypothetical protein